MAILAITAVAAIYALRANMEPAPESAGDVVSGGMSAETVMQDMIQQIEHIKEMIEEDSTNADALAALGNLYYDADMPEDAIIWYRKTLRISPDDLGVLTDMSTMQRRLGRHQEAIATLDRVIALDSTWAQAWFNRGVIYGFDLHGPDLALNAWRRFLVLNPHSERTQSVLQEIERLEAELAE